MSISKVVSAVSFILLILVVTLLSSFSQPEVFAQTSVTTLPKVIDYKRAEPAIAPQGFLILAEHTRPTYSWVKYTQALTQEQVDDFRIRSIFLCELPCENDVYSSKSYDGDYVTLFTVELEVGQTLRYLIGDINRGDTLTQNGVVVTPTVASSGPGWTLFEYTADHKGVFDVEHQETRFAMYLVEDAVTPTVTVVVKTPTATATVTPDMATVQATTTQTSTIVVPTKTVTITPSPVPPTATPVPTVADVKTSLTGQCNVTTQQVFLEYYSSETCAVTVQRNGVVWETFTNEEGHIFQLIDFQALFGQNTYVASSSCGTTTKQVDTFGCFIDAPTGLTPEANEPARKNQWLPVVKR